MKWRVLLEPDLEMDDWAVWCSELPGCNSADNMAAAAESFGEYLRGD